MSDAIAELERSVHAALETYSNVHRGSGQLSLASTHIFDQARDLVLEHLGLGTCSHTVVFCSPRSARALEAQLAPGSYQVVSSQDLGLPLGVRALAVPSRTLPGGAPQRAGGGTARLVGRGWVVWARGAERFEAGTPSIVHVIALARALQLLGSQGALQGADEPEPSVDEVLYRDALEAHTGLPLATALRQTLVGRGVQVPTTEGVRPYIHLDNGASTPTFEPIWQAWRQTLRLPAEAQEAVVEEVRALCGRFLGAPSADYVVVFTSNTTESIHLVAESLAREPRTDVEPVILNTVLEHNSNELPWRSVPGASLVRLGVDAEGFVDLDELEAVLSAHDHVALLSVSGASNVLGTCNDLPAIVEIAHRHGVKVLVDAAQLVAHRPIELERWGIDYLAFSAHKAYAPFGAGVLVARRGLLGFDEAEWGEIHASGDENAAGIAALGKALVLLQRIGLDEIQREERALTERALRGMAQIPDLQVHGVTDLSSPRFDRRAGVIAFHFPDLMSDRVAAELAARAGVGVRYGCHCAHLLVKRVLGVGPALELFQRVLVSLLPRIQLPGVTRVSLGLGNSEADVDTLVRTLRDIAAQPRRSKLKPALEAFAADAARRVYALEGGAASQG